MREDLEGLTKEELADYREDVNKNCLERNNFPKIKLIMIAV